MIRRHFLNFSGMALLSSASVPFSAKAETIAPLKLSEAEWKKRLSPQAFAVLRQAATETPFTSALLNEHRKGTFVCAGCDLPLFVSSKKYDSGTGWPSFFEAIRDHVGFKSDFELIYERKEYHCVRCGGHHGHLFDDGPKPTGLRYCNNGVALKFVPDKA